MKKLFVLFFAFLLILPLNVSAKDNDIINIYLFYSDSCPHCKAEKAFLNELKEKDKSININLYEISKNKENSALLEKVQELIDGKSGYIPYTVIGSKYKVGFADHTKVEIQSIIDAYKKGDYVNIVGGIIDGEITSENISEYLEKADVLVEDVKDSTINFLGWKISLKGLSLPLISIVMGLVDGFNPCAMWVLLFLIGMLLGIKDKRKMWYLGSLFIFSSACVYLVFMLAWLNVVVNISQIKWVQILIALVALGGAFINIKSFIKERKKESGCQVVNEEKRKKIFDKIKNFTREKSIFLATFGVIGLAISVNIVELACSAGLPVLFTNILAVNKVSMTMSNLYILLYILFFMLDDLIIFFVAMFTLQVTGITTKYTKYTHLIGGIIMLLVGLLLIFKPEWIMFNF